MTKYSIGIDYGTLSARALLVDLESGDECAEEVYEYPHAVMSETFLDGTALPTDFALQHPKDYLEALAYVIPAVLKKAGVSGEDVVGIGIDFTQKSLGFFFCFEKAGLLLSLGVNHRCPPRRLAVWYIGDLAAAFFSALHIITPLFSLIV